MDTTILLDAIAALDAQAQAIREGVSTLPASAWGVRVPSIAYPMSIFVPVLLWAMFLVRPTLVVGVCVLAWLGSVTFWISQPAALALFQLVAAWGVAVLLCAAAALDRVRRRQLRVSLQIREAELASASDDLDRERLWRRASGDDRAVIDDANLRDLVAKVSEAPPAVSKAS